MARRKMVDGVIVDCTPEEEVAADLLESMRLAEQPKQLIQQQIAALEAQVTGRRIREAIRGSGKQWLDGVDDQIAALRAQL